MADQSHLDLKYFIDSHVYNCPFCNRRNVAFNLVSWRAFHWTDEKRCHIYIVQCGSCKKLSMHLSYENLLAFDWNDPVNLFKTDIDLDAAIFYSVPTSFFALDGRIPAVIRELIAEADGCLKMNFLTGASACARKAIYELLVLEKAPGERYDEKIKALKTAHPEIDPTLIDVLGHIQGMTSDKVHEQSWPKWDSKNLRLILETLKVVLHEVYVAPALKGDRSKRILGLLEDVKKQKS
jgi:transcription elongation factor Elf1